MKIQKPFNLTLALGGARVETKDGRAARILSTDLHGSQPLVVALSKDNSEEETVHAYTRDGHYYYPSASSPADLVIVEDDEEQPKHGVYVTKLKDLSCFSVRTQNILMANDIMTVDDITKLCKTDILKFRNSGRGTLAEIENFFTKYDLKWKYE